MRRKRQKEGAKGALLDRRKHGVKRTKENERKTQ
jgi:hypothetical protein